MIADSLTLTLSSPVTGNLVPDGTSSIVAIPSQGQSVLTRFTGTAGQYYSLGILDGGASFIANANLTALNPDGSVLTYGLYGAIPATGHYYGVGVLNLGPLPTSGAYSILIQQTGAIPKGTDIDSLNLTLAQPVTGVLPVDGTTSSATVVRGQGILKTFSGTAGQTVSLTVASGVTLPAPQSPDGLSSAKITVLKPDGSTLTTGNYSATFSGGNNGSYQGTTTLNLGPLPVAGTYSILIQQTPALTGGGFVAGTLQLTLQ
jgi:hypothetical protein